MKDREKGDTDKNLGKRKVEEKSRTKTRNDKKDEKRQKKDIKSLRYENL